MSGVSAETRATEEPYHGPPTSQTQRELPEVKVAYDQNVRVNSSSLRQRPFKISTRNDNPTVRMVSQTAS